MDFWDFGKKPEVRDSYDPKERWFVVVKKRPEQTHEIYHEESEKRFLSCSYGNLFEGGGDDYLRRESSQYEILCHSTLNPRLNV